MSLNRESALFDGVVCLCWPLQDYIVQPKSILGLWQQRKLNHFDTVQEFVKTRARSLNHLISLVQYVESNERQKQIDSEIAELKAKLESDLLSFRVHPLVNEWKNQYAVENMGKLHRFKMLLLRGASQCGKSMFAKHLFGSAKTLVLGCQKNTTSLPSMRQFDRSIRKAVLLDEVSPLQVLEFKALLQSTVEKIQLAQSQCGQHRYDVWVYGVAWILASNDFSLEPNKVVSEEDSEWLKKT
jgi:hypothetical protein